jgi:elongation factor G
MTVVVDELTPVFERAVELMSGSVRARLLSALSALAADPEFRLTVDLDVGQAVLAGSDEGRLDAKINELCRTCGFAVKTGASQAAYRETITQRVDVDYTHKKLLGGGGEFARVKLAVGPSDDKPNCINRIDVTHSHVPARFIIGIERGLATQLGSGPQAGFPVVGVAITLVDGAYHEVDSSAATFETATRWALRDALKKGSPVLLEPIVKLQVTAPEDLIGPVIADLASRGGQIGRPDIRDGVRVIAAIVPATKLLGYSGALQSIAGGRAIYAMQFDHYAPVHLPDDPPFRPAIGMRA